MTTLRSAPPEVRTDDDEMPRPAPTWVRIGVAIVIAAGVVARFLPRGSLWLDEALTSNIAELPLGRIGSALHHDGHPPLYYWILHVWGGLVGWSPWALRSLSGLFGVATLPLIWLAARQASLRTSDRDDAVTAARARRTAWCAVVVLAALPFAIRYSSETRMYSLVMLLVTTGYLVVDRHLRRPSWWTAVGTAVLAGLLLWTHYWAIWLLGTVGLLLLVDVVLRHRRGDTARRNADLGLVAALVVGGLTFLPWVPTLLYQSAHTGTPWGDVLRPAAYPVIGIIYFSGGQVAESQLVAYLVAGLIVLGLFGLTNTRGRIELALTSRPNARREGAVVLLTIVLASVASLVARSSFGARYLAMVVPLVVLVVAAGLSAIRRDGWRWAVAIVVLAGFAAGTTAEVVRIRTQAGQVADQVVQALDANPSGPRPYVVTCPDQNGPSVQRALRDRGVAGKVDVVAYPRLDDPRFVDWVDYQQRNERNDPAAVAAAIESRAAGRPLFLALTGNYKTLEGQCEALQGALTQARGQPKDLVKPDQRNEDEPGIQLLEFPSP